MAIAQRILLVLFLATTTLERPACAQSEADLNGDGSVNEEDLLLLVGQWTSRHPGSATGTQVGWMAEMGGGSPSYGVSGRAVVTSATSIRLENFHYLNNGPDVFVYLIVADGTGDFTHQQGVDGQSVFSFTRNLSQPYQNATLEIEFPQGITISPYTHIAVWCRQFGIDFGSGKFFPPAVKR